MSRQDAHAVFAELAAGHALYALEPEDEQAFLAHLSGCAACERDVAEHRETLAHLAYAADADEPPPSVLEGIRAGVRESGRASTFAEPVSLSEARAERKHRRPSPRLRRAATWVGAAAAFALVGSLTVWNTSLQREQDERAGSYQALVDRIAEDGAQTVQLKSEEGDEVLAVAIVQDGTMSLVVNGLAPNDADATSYVLWGRNDRGGVRAVGSFDVASTPSVLSGMRLDDEMTAFMLTQEDGNTPPPVSTQPLLAVGEV